MLPTIGDDVIRSAQGGDERAFDEIVRTYEDSVLEFVQRLVRDRALAEDVTQDVFVRVYRSLPRFEARAKFTSWLFGIARNRAIDELRSLKRRPPTVELVPDVEPPAPETSFEERETIAAVWDAVARVPGDLRAPLLLRDVVGLSYTEIADGLGVPLSTVKWRIYKAREEVALAVRASEVRSATSPESAVMR